jgi:hypothetical protein
MLMRRPADALPAYQASWEMHRRVLAPGDPRILYPQLGLATTFIALSRFAEAEPLLLDAADQCVASAASRRMHSQNTLNHLVELYAAWHVAEPDKGYDAKADAWREKLPPTATPSAPTQPASQPTATQPAGR